MLPLQLLVSLHASGVVLGFYFVRHGTRQQSCKKFSRFAPKRQNYTNAKNKSIVFHLDDIFVYTRITRRALPDRYIVHRPSRIPSVHCSTLMITAQHNFSQFKFHARPCPHPRRSHLMRLRASSIREYWAGAGWKRERAAEWEIANTVLLMSWLPQTNSKKNDLNEK